MRSGWKDRYIVLEGSMLHYHKPREGGGPGEEKGKIDLSSAEVFPIANYVNTKPEKTLQHCYPYSNWIGIKIPEGRVYVLRTPHMQVNHQRDLVLLLCRFAAISIGFS